MKNIKIGRITLAFTFIALGIIMFLEKFTSFKLMNLLFMLWPVIIIALGLEIILSSFSKDKDYKRRNNLDILSISVIIILVTILSALNFSSKFLTKIYKYNENVSEQVIIDENKKLIIDESNIDIEVIKSESKEMKVRLEGECHHDEDMKYGGSLLKVTQVDGATKVERRVKSNTVYFMTINTGSMKYIVELPRGTELEIENSYGDIRIKDIESNVTIKSNDSDIDFENIKGNISIISKNGDVVLDSNFIENVDIETENSDVTLKLPKEQTGKFNIISTYGSIDDELGFSVIESASMDSINEVRKVVSPIFNIRTNKGDITIETD